jgi:hypothetical protein
MEDKMPTQNRAAVNTYARYPFSSLILYNGMTVLHFLLGGIGIMVGYGNSWVGPVFGVGYLVFSFIQMYVVMPLTVCPNCIYYGLEKSRCVSGLNMISRKIAKEGRADRFALRATGILCHNNLYMAALVAPALALIPSLILDFTLLILVIFLALAGLLLLRIFVVFTKVACIYCRAKEVCPNAQSMGIT